MGGRVGGRRAGQGVDDIWLKIVNREFVNGLAVLTDEKGTRYTVLSCGPWFEGVMTKDESETN